MYFSITPEPIDAAALLERVRRDEDGAVVLFTGVVRNHHRGRRVEGLRYEAYAEMAGEVLERIGREAAEKYGAGDVAVVHRVGPLEIGEASVAIAVAAPHRDAAYRTSREIIERLKREVPIWKLERYADGQERWLEGARPPDG